MNKTNDKRQKPAFLSKLLATDVYLTDQFVKFLEKISVFRQLQLHCRALEISCHALLWFPGWIALIWLLNNKNIYQMQVNFLIGLFLDIVVTAVSKAYTRRRRPSKNESSFDIGPDQFSFPSGHASRSTYIAFFFMFNWSIHYLLLPSLILWAFSVSISRILMRRHHLLDVAAGIFFGFLESCLIGLIYLDNDTCSNLIWWLTDEKLDGGEYHV